MMTELDYNTVKEHLGWHDIYIISIAEKLAMMCCCNPFINYDKVYLSAVKNNGKFTLGDTGINESGLDGSVASWTYTNNQMYEAYKESWLVTYLFANRPEHNLISVLYTTNRTDPIKFFFVPK